MEFHVFPLKVCAAEEQLELLGSVESSRLCWCPVCSLQGACAVGTRFIQLNHLHSHTLSEQSWGCLKPASASG